MIMPLWLAWWEAMCLLRPAFSRNTSFLWFSTIVAGLMTRVDLLGVTSVIRALRLEPKRYKALLNLCHSSSVDLHKLTVLWTQLVRKLIPGVVLVNGRLVLVGDGVKVGKRGLKMPAVKSLFQAMSNTKPARLMGHSLQAVSLLAHAGATFMSVPLAARIHEGIVASNATKRTLLDKMLKLLDSVELGQTFYFVADAYYASGKIIKGLLAQGNHLVTRMRSNSVAYELPVPAPGRRGRPRKYGEKTSLQSLFAQPGDMQEAISPVYGEEQGKHRVTIRYRVCDLLWRPAGVVVRFVAVCHPIRGNIILMSTDINLGALEIIQLYGLRFKIEYAFKQAIRTLGAFSYHFWLKAMTPIRRGSGNQYTHREPPEYRAAVARKIHAYHVFIQAGIVCQGMLQYLSVTRTVQVWSCFQSWLRTVRDGIPPSEFVTAKAVREALPEFLLARAATHIFAKFIVERQDPGQMGHFAIAA
jgi:DDE superfamily endonuclease